EQCEQFAFVDVQTHVIAGIDLAVSLGDVLDAQEGLRGRILPGRHGCGATDLGLRHRGAPKRMTCFFFHQEMALKGAWGGIRATEVAWNSFRPPPFVPSFRAFSCWKSGAIGRS